MLLGKVFEAEDDEADDGDGEEDAEPDRHGERAHELEVGRLHLGLLEEQGDTPGLERFGEVDRLLTLCVKTQRRH